MPRLIKSARAKPSSNSPANPSPKAAPPSPQFTESEHSSPDSGSSRPQKTPDSAEQRSPDELSAGELSLDATEPFPPGLFRVPIPDAVFEKMPELSDSALRCLLALIHLSFRFDPEKSEWVHAEGWFTRREMEEASGLSDQATRDGLDELQSLGFSEVDRSGRSHHHRLLLSVPDRRFTYVPTALLEQAPDVASGTDLRVVLAVLRRTWGWTYKETDPQSGREKTLHDRWAQLSIGELASATGRSKTAIRQAAGRLSGQWIDRGRPGNGAYQYRFLPEAVESGPEGPSSFSEENANDLTPDRQVSGGPSSYKESSCRDKHGSQDKSTSDTSSQEPRAEKVDAVPRADSSTKQSSPEQTEQKSSSHGKAPPPDFSSLPPEKQDLAEKLSNVGLWAGRIAEVLSRFSTGRIRANFQLYRQRASEQAIRKPGAWLYQAITEGYVLPDSIPEEKTPTGSGRLPPLEHKETVSEEKKDAYVTQGVSKERFHRCLSGQNGSDERHFMYFNPEVGTPSRRRSACTASDQR